jgi:hypothetical protein
VDDFTIPPPIDLAALDAIIQDTSLTNDGKDRGLQAAVSHGGLVLHHTSELLTAADPSGTLNAVPVDIGHYEILRVAEEVQREMVKQFNIDPSMPTTRFVINMSFAAVPCVVANDFKGVVTPEYLENPENFDFDAYVIMVEENEQNSWLAELEISHDQLLTLLTTPLVELTADPLLVLIQNPCEIRFEVPENAAFVAACETGGIEINYVAAAGNSGPAYRVFQPAAWPEVIGVGASEVELGGDVRAAASHWESSNQGDVYRPGAWFQLSGGDTKYDAYYVGTSFAAPVESVAEALDLSQ